MSGSWSHFLIVALGGGLGSAARFGLSGFIDRTAASGLPWGTLFVNAVGSFLLGLLLTTGAQNAGWDPRIRLGLGTGMLGGFTTYSTFNYETIQLAQRGQHLPALLNLSGTVLVCILFGWAGIAAGRLISPNG